MAVSQRPVLQGLCYWICAPGHEAASPWSCHPAPQSCSWPRSPLRDPLSEQLRVAPGAAQPPPYGASSSAGGTAAKLLPGHAAPSVQSRCPSPSELLPSQCMCPAALRELGALSWGVQVSLSVPGCPRTSPPSWGPALTPCGHHSTQEDWCRSCFSETELSCPGDTAPALARLLTGPLPLGCLLFLYFFFPSSYLDRSVNFSYCSIPAGLSLNRRQNLKIFRMI